MTDGVDDKMLDVCSLEVEVDDNVIIGISWFIVDTGMDEVTLDFDVSVVEGSDVDSVT